MLRKQAVRFSVIAGIGLSALFTQGCGDDNKVVNINTDGGADDGGVHVPATLIATPAMFDFTAPVLVGASSAPVTFTITNTSATATSGPLTAGVTGPDKADFKTTSTCGAALSPGQSCTIDLTFVPLAAGVKSVTVGVVGTGTEAAGAKVTAKGVNAAALTVTPVGPNFGSIQIGDQSQPVELTVTNTGGITTGAIAAVLSGGQVSDFAVSANTCAAALAPGEMCKVTVRFAPTAIGTKTSALVATANPGGMASAAITGRGIKPTDIKVSPTPIDFGSSLIGASSDNTTVTVTNSGDTAAAGITVSIAGANKGDFSIDSTDCGLTLGAGATCTVKLFFKPTAAGDRAGLLNVSATSAGVVSVGLSGKGLAPAKLSFVPTAVNFGPVEVAKSGGAIGFTLTNSGDVPTGAIALAATGANKEDFIVDSDGCTGNLIAKGGSCVVQVRFKPSAQGARAGRITATGTPGGSANADFTGTGLAPGSLSVDPATGVFASVVMGAESAATTFKITNNGQAASGSLSVIVVGANPGDFLVPVPANSCQGKSLAGGESCTLSVVFKPAQVGGRAATIAINGGVNAQLSLPVTGTGLSQAALALSPEAANFGSVALGQASGGVEFTLSNGGQSASGVVTVGKAGTNPDDFNVTGTCNGNTVPGLGSCKMTVTFAPKLTSALGEKTSMLSVTIGATVLQATLTGTAVSVDSVKIEPSTATFANTIVDQATSGSGDVEITVINDAAPNTGNITVTFPETVEFTKVSDSCNGVALVKDTSCKIRVRFNPKSAGAKNVVVKVVTASGNTVTSSLTGVGIDRLQIAEGEGAFGTAITHAFSDADGIPAKILNGPAQTFTIKCNATACGVLNFTLPAGAEVVRTDAQTEGRCISGTTALTAGQTCSISLRFAPQTSGAKAGTLTVAGGAKESVTAALSGAAVKPLRIQLVSVTPAPAANFPQVFPDTTIGAFSTARYKVTYWGTGSATLPNTDPLNVALTGANVDQFAASNVLGGEDVTCAGSALNNGQSCLVDVRFIPTMVAADPKTATLTVSGRATGEDVATNLSGKGVPGAMLMVSPASLTFGPIITGGVTAAQEITVTNAAGSFMAPAISAVTLDNTNYFEVVSNACTGMVLPGGGSCKITVRFKPPAGTLAGAPTGTLSFSAGAFNGVVALSGSSLSPITVTPATAGMFDFGAHPRATDTDQVFTVTNAGSAALASPLSFGISGTNVQNFTIANNGCASPLAGAASCTVTVRYNTAGGINAAAASHTANLNVSGANINLVVVLNGSRIAQPVLGFTGFNVETATADFGSVWIGSIGAVTKTFTVANSGGLASGAVTILASVDFPVAGGTCVTGSTGDKTVNLAPGASCTVIVKFAPTGAAGTKAGTLEVRPATGGAPLGTGAAKLSGEARPNTQVIATPNSNDFGTIVAGQVSDNFVVTLSNPSGGTAGASVAATVADATNYEVVAGGTCGGALAANATCTVLVRYKPAAAATPGATQATTLTINAGAAGTTTVALSGRVNQPASLQLSLGGSTLTSVGFGQIVVGATDTRTIHVTNVGDQVSGVPTLNLTGADLQHFAVAAGTCNVAVPAKGACDFTVTFSPIAPGPKSVSVNFGSTPGGSFTIPVTGEALGKAGVSLSPTQGTFQAGAITATSAGLDFVVLNAAGAVPTSALTVVLSDNKNFTFSGCQGVTLEGGQTCTVTVKQTPSSLTPATYSTTLKVSGTVGGSDMITITGGGFSALTASPSSKAYNNVALGSSVTQTFAIKLDATAGVSSGPLGTLVSGANVADFSVVSDNCAGQSLVPGGTCNVVVAFVPTVAGARTANVKVTTQSGISTVDVALSGSGTAAP